MRGGLKYDTGLIGQSMFLGVGSNDRLSSVDLGDISISDSNSGSSSYSRVILRASVSYT